MAADDNGKVWLFNYPCVAEDSPGHQCQARAPSRVELNGIEAPSLVEAQGIAPPSPVELQQIAQPLL